MEQTGLLRASPPLSYVDTLPSLLGEALALVGKQARACVFAGSFFAVLALSRHLPLGPLPRYDFLLLAALAMQAMLLRMKLETPDELKTICLFHVTGLALEIFKTHPAIASWSYPEFAYSKIFGAPLYSGFMHAAVASYLVQAWRLFDLRLSDYPDARWTLLLAAAIYVNFFSHHYIGDYRWWLFAALLLVFGRTRLHFTPWRKMFWLPLPLCFLLIGAFVWIAENIGTFYGAWVYPDQQSGWKLVHWGKISSWTLLVVITFVIVADLKHLKQRRAARW
ncbi:MAG TPA: DUF817 domain-containing protein [Arenimonas sp.]|uniref:DUF817 domain-containing protein n=1 Tax=Arenimonas sp. TaxID=1872635 RepID=UPI002C31CBCC|nr:DUF817 domain-containing protein [Arenimonas sp.]HMB57343.1 DUF817 domain-containing protein [Arenimonas sp.]